MKDVVDSTKSLSGSLNLFIQEWSDFMETQIRELEFRGEPYAAAVKDANDLLRSLGVNRFAFFSRNKDKEASKKARESQWRT